MPNDTPNKLFIGVDATPLCRETGGIGRYTHDLIKQLAQTHKEAAITLVGFRGDQLKKGVEDSLPSNVKFHKLPLPRRIYQIAFARLFAWNVGRLLPRFDVFLHPNFTLFPYIKQKGLKSFVIVHDTAYIDFPEVVEPRNRSYLNRRVPWSIKRAYKVLSISRFTADRIKDSYLFAENKNEVIGTGIDDAFFKHVQSKTKQLSFVLPKSYILFVGTLEPRKNLEVLIKAHSIMPNKLRSEYPLLLAGNIRADAKQLGLLIKESEYVQTTGFVSDFELAVLYQNAKLFVTPSRYEGFGIPLVEAMSKKVPIIASDIPIFRSIAENTVTFVDTKTPESLSKAITEALNNGPDKAQLDKAYSIAKNYSWDKVVERLWSVLKTGEQ